MANQLHKFGGIAAFIEAITFIVGFWFYFTLLGPASYGSMDVDPSQHIAFLSQNQQLLYIWYWIIYILFGIALVVLTFGIASRLQDESPQLTKVASAFGLIWAGLVIASGMVANIGIELVVNLQDLSPERAATTWYALNFVVNGLGGGNEIVGGIWVLMISWAGLQSQKLPRLLNYLGLVIGFSGLLTSIPLLKSLGAVFGLGLILWFVWIGVALVRD